MKPPRKPRAPRGVAYRAWSNMHTRCSNPNNIGYKNYGGRGIKVAERWHAFQNFIDDMGAPPAGHTLDRIDNDADYSPGNCRWAPRALQSRNTRRNVWVTLNGERACLKDALRMLGYSYQAYKHLHDARGWGAQQIIDAWLGKPTKSQPFPGDPKPTPPRMIGASNASAKLDEVAVKAIRASAEPLSTLAAIHGVTKAAVAAIRSRRTWRHIA